MIGCTSEALLAGATSAGDGGVLGRGVGVGVVVFAFAAQARLRTRRRDAAKPDDAFLFMPQCYVNAAGLPIPQQ
ncbi:MAG: hypothetical protein DLM52_12675 [Chthoniobacterales bacterium]|nr:MAG: hypothetical protein DLM52_12675 [Chthoniobacterales bacterium]